MIHNRQFGVQQQVAAHEREIVQSRTEIRTILELLNRMQHNFQPGAGTIVQNPTLGGAIHGTLNSSLSSGGSSTITVSGEAVTVHLYLGGTIEAGTKVHAVLDVDENYYVIAADCPEE